MWCIALLCVGVFAPTAAAEDDRSRPSQALTSAAAAPTIASDQPDYAPGSTVSLTGGGWQPGEAVHITVNDDLGQSWLRSADVVADGDGQVSDTFSLPNWFVATYTVVATGSSGTATMSFTDAAFTVAASAGVTYPLTSQGFSDSTCQSAVGGENGRHPTTVTAGQPLSVNLGNAGFARLTAGAAAAPAARPSSPGEAQAGTPARRRRSASRRRRRAGRVRLHRDVHRRDIGPASQTITFAAPAGKSYGDADFDPGATASSGLPVHYAASTP